MKYAGRKEPYTTRGIGRIPCSRCGKPSVHQWNSCANGHYYMPCCLDCDILLNFLILDFMKVQNRSELMQAYEKEQRGA